MQFAIYADSYHNLNVFIGERASGLGGAFTAISDDPSGTYYNPAGLAFAYENYVSISANTYKRTSKTYENVFGPGQSYTRNSNTFSPNFFGSIKAIDKLKVALSIVSPNNESFDQSNEIFMPLSLPNLSRYRIDYSEENSSYLVGPSVAYPFTTRFSLGATLYYMYDTAKISSTQFVEGYNKSFSNISVRDRRRTTGFVPIIGTQYMVTDKWSLGMSMKFTKVTGKERSVVGQTSSSASTTVDNTSISNVTDTMGGQWQGGLVFVKPGESGGIPETTDIRLGSAHFISQNLIVAYDMIYTTGYSKKQDRTQIEITQPYIFLTENENHDLERKATLNYSFGIEYFLIDTIAFRLGYYTNKSNHKKIDWLRAAAQMYAAENKANAAVISYNSPQVFYLPYNLNPPSRFEHTDNRGLTLGLTWASAKSSITFTYVLERGQGGSQINTSQLPGVLKYYSSSFYLVASTRQ